MLAPSPSSTEARYRAVHVVFALAPGFPSNPSPAAQNLASTPRPRAAVSDIGEFLFLYLPLPPFRSASECAVHLLILGRHPNVTGDVQPRFDILHCMPALTHACPRLRRPYQRPRHVRRCDNSLQCSTSSAYSLRPGHVGYLVPGAPMHTHLRVLSPIRKPGDTIWLLERWRSLPRFDWSCDNSVPSSLSPCALQLANRLRSQGYDSTMRSSTPS
ncbi:hypothetical protein FB451DRAFT_1420186 [Mycena latifolia]|nr:hypothetical protein FB451DRAFT_1420186 [Mycena latifolia]